MTKKYDVITVGSSTVDVFADSESELIKIKTMRDTEELIAYPSGSKILIKRLTFETGGGGTNTAVALSRLGLKTAYLGKIGSDENAEMILHILKKNKVDFIGVQKDGVSGYSVILKSLENDRSILAYKGINNKLRYDEIDIKRLNTNWFYFSSMVGDSYTTLELLAKYAEEKGIKITFNPSNYLAEKGPVFLREVLTRTEILVLNKDEANLLVGKWPMKELIKKLMETGPKSVVVTDGKNGAFTINKHFYHVKCSPNAKASETTGAGDAFAATFLAGIIKTGKIEKALQMAQANAESVIQHVGAKNVLLSLKELEKALKKKKIEVEKTEI